MNRFARLAIAWLAVGGLAALATLHVAGTRRSTGASPNNPRHDSGNTTQLATDLNRPVPLTRKAVLKSFEGPKAQASQPPAETSGTTAGIDIPCSKTSVPGAPISSSSITVTLPGTPASVPVVNEAGQQLGASLFIDTSGSSGNAGTIDVALLGVGSKSGSASSRGVPGESYGGAVVELFPSSGSIRSSFVVGVDNGSQCP